MLKVLLDKYECDPVLNSSNMNTTEFPHNGNSVKPRKHTKKSNTEVQINKSLALLGFVSWYDLEPGKPIKCNTLCYK